MFCPTCGCELPAIARFCVKCGSRTAPEAATTPSTFSAATGTFFCVGCGHTYESSHRFCNACGRATSTTSISPPPIENVPVLATLTEVASSTAIAAVQQLDRTATALSVAEPQP